jgi:hypothetical protein
VPSDDVIGKLNGGAFCFAMPTREYLKVQGARKTKQLLVEDIQFHKET